MWTIRFILLGVLVAFEGIGSYYSVQRSRYERLLENKIHNVVGVIVWNCLCYLIVGLPPDGGFNNRPD